MTALDAVKAYFTTADYVILGVTVALAVVGLGWGISLVIDIFSTPRLPPMVEDSLRRIYSPVPEPKRRYRYMGCSKEEGLYVFREILPDGSLGNGWFIDRGSFWEGANLSENVVF